MLTLCSLFVCNELFSEAWVLGAHKICLKELQSSQVFASDNLLQLPMCMFLLFCFYLLSHVWFIVWVNMYIYFFIYFYPFSFLFVYYSLLWFHFPIFILICFCCLYFHLHYFLIYYQYSFLPLLFYYFLCPGISILY